MFGDIRGKCLVVAVVAVLAFGGLASADAIATSSYSDLGAGVWLYEYSITNEPATLGNVYDFMFPTFGAPTGFAGPVFDVTSPTGWDWFGFDFGPGNVFAEWTEETPFPDDDFEVLPGDTLGGFSFKSLYGPGPIGAELATTDFMSYFSTVDAPQVPPSAGAIPEPATLCLAGLGLSAALGWGARRKKRRA